MRATKSPHPASLITFNMKIRFSHLPNWYPIACAANRTAADKILRSGLIVFKRGRIMAGAADDRESKSSQYFNSSN